MFFAVFDFADFIKMKIVAVIIWINIARMEYFRDRHNPVKMAINMSAMPNLFFVIIFVRKYIRKIIRAEINVVMRDGKLKNMLRINMQKVPI